MNPRHGSADLINNFTLTADEHANLTDRTQHGRLGFAILLKFFQANGRFPSNAEEIPKDVVNHIAEQIGVSPKSFRRYRWQGRSIERHRAQIRAMLGFREATVEDGEVLSQWLIEYVEASGDEHVEDAAYERLRQLKIEPPPADRLQRIARSVSRIYEHRLHEKILARLALETRNRLDALLETTTTQDEGDEDKGKQWEKSTLAELRKDPGQTGVESVLLEVAKLERLHELGLPPGLFEDLPPRVVRTYRQRVSVEPPRDLRRHPEPVRYALLSAFCWTRVREITDSLVDLLILVVHRMGSRAEQKVVKEMVEDFKRVHGKTGILFRVAQAAVDKPDGVIREVIYPVVDEKTLNALVRELGSTGTYRLNVHRRMKSSYGHHYRRILPKLLSVLEFRSNNEAHRPVLEALDLLKRHAGSRARFYPVDEQVPIDEVVPGPWREFVFKTSGKRERINRSPYEICVLEALRDRLRVKEIWVVGADRYRNPDEDLPTDFGAKREVYYKALAQPLDPETFISDLQGAMANALKKFESGLHKNSSVELIAGCSGRRSRIKLSPLKAQPDPPNLGALKKEIAERWSMTSLLDIVKETDLRTSFSEHLRSVNPRESIEPKTLQKRLLLCLYALATNLGIKRVSGSDHGENYKDLLYVRRRFIHKEQLRSAITRIVNELLAIRLPYLWGKATTACASDSKQFAAWDQNLMTEWHIRYGGRGIMIYWHVADKAICIYSQLRRCSSSEVAAMIQGVLRHCTKMAIDKQYVDTHGQSHVAFAFCHLLGFRLMPRIKGIHRQKLYRPRPGEPDAYPGLRLILTRPINWELIRQQYEEMIKYATALRLGTADAEAILRRFTRDNLKHPTYQALSELGKAVKTIFLCEYLGSKKLRHEIQEALNIIELWNGVNDFIFYGRGGEFSTNRRDGQELAMLSLHLIQNCLVYINTLMIQQVLSEPHWKNRMGPHDLRALTPLIHAHVNPYGSFHLDMDERLPINMQFSK